jgi:hypothetical protein
MLTGRFYDNSQPFERWKKEAYESASIPRILKAEGWKVDLFPKVSYSLYYSEDIASNLVRGRPAEERRLDIAAVYDLSLFRSLPHFLKRKIYNRQDWTVRRLFIRSPSKLPERKEDRVQWIRSRDRMTLKNRNLFSPAAFRRNMDVRFIDAMLAESRLADVRGTFKFYHLGGVHAPLNLNEKLAFRKMTVNRRNYIRSATASLKLMGLFLDELRRLGIYDNSMILIVGDHGAGFQGQRFVLQPGMPVEGDGEDIVTQSFRVAALPLILVKPPAARGALKVSDQPVSLADIPATVFSESACAQEPGPVHVRPRREPGARTPVSLLLRPGCLFLLRGYDRVHRFGLRLAGPGLAAFWKDLQERQTHRVARGQICLWVRHRPEVQRECPSLPQVWMGKGPEGIHLDRRPAFSAGRPGRSSRIGLDAANLTPAAT